VKKGSSENRSELWRFLECVPAVTPLSEGSEEGRWWIKLSIATEHPLAWRVVQELGFVLNYLSLDERLPTRFYPVSPPPYLNGGPTQFLSWIVENTSPDFTPQHARSWLEARLPSPVADEVAWDLGE
jgi:hypothetical protein